MKKTFKLFALMLLTAFAFSSCVDVPAPFNLPDKSSSAGGEGGSETNEGTPVTCAQAVELTNALADGATSSEVYTITGYITEVMGDVSRNQQTFWMADTKGGGRIFEAYWANLPEGVTAFTAGTKVKITGQLTKYVNANSGNVIAEMKNAIVTVLEDDGGGTSPALDGTEITCAKAVELTNALADGATSSETYTVTGYITEVIGSVSRNQQTFWMADTKDGGRVFEAYYADLPEGVTAFTVGLKVKITGQLTKYVNATSGQVTPEIKNAKVVILEDDGGQGGGEPQGDIQHITIAEFLAKADVNTTYELTGTVANIVNTTYGNFDLVEDGASIYIYGLLDLNGDARKFAELGIEEGDIVTLTGKYMLYNDKAEISNAQLVSFQKGEGGGRDDDDPTPQPGGDIVSDLVNGDFESWDNASQPTGWKSASSASNATLSQSGEAHGGSYSCMIAAPGTTNKRLATQEMTLDAGSYTFSFYAKATTSDVCQSRAGYVPVGDDGKVGTYYYGGYTDINNNSWTLVTYEFTLDAPTKLCLLVMNPKGSSYSISQDVLIDDATLTKK